MTPALLALISAAASGVLASLLLPLVRRVAHRRGWFDPPDHRKLHVGQITHLGGVAMFLAFAAVSVTAGTVLGLYSTRLAFLLLGAFTLHVIGLVDDLKNLRAFPRLLAHLAIAAIVASGGFVMRSVTIPGIGTLILGAASYPVTVLWIAAVVNALNWADGMDGHAGGISAFAALGIGLIGSIEGSALSVVLAFALFGALVAFLTRNFPPARIFMGDNGATFIGFLLAVLPFVDETNGYAGVRTLAMAILLLLPLLDFIMSIVRRTARGRSPGAPDRGHIHHRLQDMGLRPRQVLAVVYPLCGYLTLVAVAVSHPPPWLPMPVIVVALIATVVLAVLFAAILVSPPVSPHGTGTAAPRRSRRRAG
jgi:UDP-GlcNAc:undecaprenyl-phosphate GlcNAc-1-phosphate transferase